MRYLIAYDIACPRRLRRVAHFWERHAIRCQKSVFVADFPQAECQRLLDAVTALIDSEQDIIQAWRLAGGEPAEGSSRGNVPLVNPACVVHSSGKIHLIAGAK